MPAKPPSIEFEVGDWIIAFNMHSCASIRVIAVVTIPRDRPTAAGLRREIFAELGMCNQFQSTLWWKAHKLSPSAKPHDDPTCCNVSR
mmetsp:Transcript_24261/g.56932  ORF Transcript_24261/g.56932 Transcript_24261/m.56932 type:complete len:88 (+) Transcript_24261:160-423(+)